MSQKESKWEKEFDNEFDCVLWWGCRNEDGTQKHGYETDCGDELKTFIRKVIASREKEIAEEAQKMKKDALFVKVEDDGTIDEHESYNQALNDFLQIIKH